MGPRVIRRLTRLTTFVVSAAVLASCSATTEPVITDVNLARTRWLANHPTSYRFELAMATSWTPKGEYFRVEVQDGVVASVRDESGHLVASHAPTLDEIWSELLGAKDRGEFNGAEFSTEGVPLMTNYGRWEVDGGVAYFVRNFARVR